MHVPPKVNVDMIALDTLIKARERIEQSKRRKNLWYLHGEGKHECFVYKPQYCKELMEVSDWRPMDKNKKGS